MDRGEKIIITLLSKIVGHLEGVPANEVLKAVLAETAPKESVPVKKTDPNTIDSIYKLYPSTCPISGRSLGKCSKNKTQIDTLLKTRTPEDIRATIAWYVDDCKKTNTYLKNFTTLLNQFPESVPVTQEPRSKKVADNQEEDFWDDPLFKEWEKEQDNK